MAILVTGGAGFIGSHIAEALLERGRTVVVLDNLDPYYAVGIKERNLELCRALGGERFSFIEGSVTDADVVESVISDHAVDYIYHEAAQAGVRTSVEDPLKPHRVNTTGLLNVLLAAERSGVRRVINASSSSVYGRPDYLPYDEDHPNYPRSPYGVSKLAGEHYCSVFDSLYDVSTVNLRYFTVYGPRMRPNMAISNFVSRCLNGEPPVIYGDGEQTRDFTYIDDVVEANLALRESKKADGETMNIGSTETVSVNDLARHVIAETGANVEPVYEPSKEADAPHTHANVDRARAAIGYEPEVEIFDGVNRFIQWYRANQDWYEPLVMSS